MTAAPAVTAPRGHATRYLVCGTAFIVALLLAVSLALLPFVWHAITDPFTTQAPWLLNGVLTAILGSLIALRRPRNPIGWLLLATAVTDGLSAAGIFIAWRGQLSGASPASWVEWPAWVGNWAGGVGGVFLITMILFFPTGRLPSPRWRPALVVTLILAAAFSLVAVIGATPAQPSSRLPAVPPPFAIRPLVQSFNGGNGPAGLVIAVLMLPSLASIIVRFRRAGGAERTQLKWFAWVAAVSLGVVIASFPIGSAGSQLGNTVAAVGFDVGVGVLLPLTIGLAVIKHGLYDIDVFLNRAVVYGSLAVFITSVYVAIAVGLGAVVGGGGKPNLALSILATAVVAVGFQPVRERMQRVANRLVYGVRATPYEVLSRFSAQVAETYAAEEVLDRMARLLREGSGAEQATVWLRRGHELLPAATFPQTMSGLGLPAMPVLDGTLPHLPAASASVAVRHQGQLLGALSVTKRSGESLSPLEARLLDDLAHQAGLVLRNVGLTADLRARVDDLRASRQRLVTAQDEARRHLERNLHDGAQQQLVALKVKLGLTERMIGRDPARAGEMLAGLKSETDETLETLRDLARGIYPPLLADSGLVAALESQARKAVVPVQVKAEGVGRYTPEVEATVYFCMLEALQNIQKYAHATCATIRILASDGSLRFTAEDDGCGFDVSTAARGAGLTNMRDRIDALGGELIIASTPGKGTTVGGTLPVVTTLQPD